MSGKMSRNKGRAGQLAARNLLSDMDYSVAELNAGTAVEDLLAVDATGHTWSVEVKNTKEITYTHVEQAMRQAAARKLPWMCMNKIYGTSSWLIRRKGCKPCVWHEKADGSES